MDEGWKVLDVEPEVAPVNGNGHHDAFGPTVELVPAAGHSNGNGHYDDAGEPQQSLFSWAEFMAEPVKPKRRSRKPRPASISMFEWALELEQEREKETVGARR